MIKGLIVAGILIILSVFGFLILSSNVFNEKISYLNSDKNNPITENACYDETKPCSLANYKPEIKPVENYQNKGCSQTEERCTGLDQQSGVSCYKLPDQQIKTNCIKSIEQIKGCYVKITTKCGDAYIVRKESCYDSPLQQKEASVFKQPEQVKGQSCYKMYDTIHTKVPCIQ